MTQLDRPTATVPRPPGAPPKAGPPWYRKRRWWLGALAALIVVGGVVGGLVATSGTEPAGSTAPSGTTTAPSATTTTPTTTAPTASTTAPGIATAPASAAVTTALATALTTEEQAKATYDNVVSQFGAVAPFSTVSSAEAQHIDTVRTLAQRYSVTLPTGPVAGQPAPTTLTAACQLGVATEQQVISTYDQLLPQVSGYADLTQAFSNLQAAARDSHLPAFQRCA